MKNLFQKHYKYDNNIFIYIYLEKIKKLQSKHTKNLMRTETKKEDFLFFYVFSFYDADLICF